jgi:hypothetical protein
MFVILLMDNECPSGFPDPDPSFQVKSETKNKLKQFFSFFLSKIAIYLSLGLHKGLPSYRRSLHPSKENIQHFKT